MRVRTITDNPVKKRLEISLRMKKNPQEKEP